MASAGPCSRCACRREYAHELQAQRSSGARAAPQVPLDTVMVGNFELKSLAFWAILMATVRATVL